MTKLAVRLQEPHLNSQDRTIKGRCYCSRVQFELTPPTLMFSHCHCESCRRSHGAAFVSWTSVPDQQFRMLTGDQLVKGYQSSPGIVWKFCSHCGSPLFQTTRHSPGITYVSAAALESPLDRPAECHVSFEEKVDWLDVADALPKYRQKTSDLLRGGNS